MCHLFLQRSAQEQGPVQKRLQYGLGDGLGLPRQDGVPALEELGKLAPFQGGTDDIFNIEYLADGFVEFVVLVDKLQDLTTLQQPTGLRLLFFGQSDLTSEITPCGLLESRPELGIEGRELPRVREPVKGELLRGLEPLKSFIGST